MDFLHKVIALTRHRPTQEQLLEAFLRFESGLRVSLMEPGQHTSIRDFIDQLDSKKTAWFENYANYSKRPWSSNTLTQSGNQHQTHENHRNQRFGPQQDARQNQNPFRNRGAAPGQGNRYTTSTPAAITGPTPSVYHSDTLPVAPATRPAVADSTSHTPRRFGNTHDADSEDEELGVYYNSTGYGCNVDGCTHRYNALP